MLGLVINKEDADYWNPLIASPTVDLDENNIPKNTLLQRWAGSFPDGIQASLQVVSGDDVVWCEVIWSDKQGAEICHSDPCHTRLEGEWRCPVEGHDVFVYAGGIDKGENTDDTAHTFEQGKTLVEKGGLKPDKDGWIRTLGAPCMTLARHLKDPDDGCRVVGTANGDIAEAWDYCMGILAGMGYGSVWHRIVFIDDDNPRFELELNVGKNDMLGFRLAMKDNRWYALESYKSYREQAAVLTRMWKAVEKDTPPRLRDNVIQTLEDFRSLDGDPDGVFTMTDCDHNVLRFEIHRGALLRLDDEDRVTGVGVCALFTPNPVSWCC